MEFALRLVTPAQIKNLVATPITLIPAPTPKAFLYVLNATWALKFNSIPYGNPSGFQPYIAVGNPATSPWSASTASPFIENAVDTTFNSNAVSGGQGNTAEAAGQPVVLLNFGPLEYTLGDSTLEIFISYNLIPLP